MNNKKKEGSFYASKVRLFLNEYGGENLQEFCNAENVSYTKMCHCLGRPAYRKPKVTSAPPRGEESDGSDALLPVIDLQPLVVDMPNHSTDSSSSSSSSLPSPSKQRLIDSSIEQFFLRLRSRRCTREKRQRGCCQHHHLFADCLHDIHFLYNKLNNSFVSNRFVWFDYCISRRLSRVAGWSIICDSC